MGLIENTDIIKVPYNHFESLMLACCIVNNCENKPTCKCREIIIDNPPEEKYNYE